MYTIDSVDKTIKHEVLHHLASLIYNEPCNHDERWKELAIKYNVIPDSHWNIERSSIFYKVARNKYKYITYCEKCNAEWLYKSNTKAVKYSDAYTCECGGRIISEKL